MKRVIMSSTVVLIMSAIVALIAAGPVFADEVGVANKDFGQKLRDASPRNPIEDFWQALRETPEVQEDDLVEDQQFEVQLGVISKSKVTAPPLYAYSPNSYSP